MSSLLSTCQCALKLTCHVHATRRFRLTSSPVKIPGSTCLRFVLHIRPPYGAHAYERNLSYTAPIKSVEVDERVTLFRSIGALLFRPALAQNLPPLPSPKIATLAHNPLAQNQPPSPTTLSPKTSHPRPQPSRPKPATLAHTPMWAASLIPSLGVDAPRDGKAGMSYPFYPEHVL